MPNLPSFRFPFASLGKLPPEAQAAHLATFNALTDIYQAIAQQKENSSTSTTTVNETVLGTSGTSSTAGVTSFNGETGAVSYFPDLSLVNNQTGETVYVTQDTDNGAFIVLDDASPIAVGLNYTVGTPWFTFIANFGTTTATLTPSNVPSGATSNISYASNLAASSMPLLGGYWVGVWFDGQNFWAATLPIVPVNTPGAAHQFFTAYNSSSGIFSEAQPAFTDVSGTAAVTQGGTGATTAAGARANLGAAASGANSDITSLTGLTTPLPVSEGGTGTTTPGLVAGTNISITGTWPDQTIATAGFSGTITTAKLTGGGTNGSMTFVAGALTAQTPAT